MVMFGGVECESCGRIVELENARARTVEVETGRSGGSVTVRGGLSSGMFGKKPTSRKSGGLSYNTGRKYYRNVKVYVCNECVAREQAESAQAVAGFFGLVLFGLIIWGCVWTYDYLGTNIPIWKEAAFGPSQETIDNNLKKALQEQQLQIAELKAKTEAAEKEKIELEAKHKKEMEEQFFKELAQKEELVASENVVQNQ